MTRRSRSLRRSSLDHRSAVVKEEVTEQVRAHQKLESLITAQLTSELSAMTRMQQVSARLGRAGDFSTLLHDIIDAAIEITRADMGAIQLLEDGALKIVAQRGFGAPFLDFFNMTREGQAACGAAIQKGERVIVEDVANSHIFAGAPALDVMLAAGARAVQSTPLVSRSGHVLGMFSTHYRAPRRASEHELRQLDVLARQAADFIERNRAEEALRHRSEQYETLLNQAPLGVYLVDADFRIREVNPVALSFFGDVPDLIGRDFDEVIHTLWTKEYADEIVRVFRNTLGTGESYETPERVEFRVDRGVVEYHEWRIDRILLPDGRHGVVCYSRDISAQVQAREKIRESEERYRELARENQRLYEQEQKAREAAESATRAKDEFLAIVSHELRAPLNAIFGYNHMLREKPPDAARLKSSCDLIERNVKTQLRLIEDLLDSARIVSGKLRLELRAVNINPVIADAIDVVRPAAEAKGVCLRVAEEDGSGREESAPPNQSPAIVRGDAARLQQIIWNLLSNAIKFTPAGGRVELRAELAEGQIRVIVSDTGDGIPPEFLPYVFDRFRQADQSGSQRYGGLGLGLALVKHLVELHGGKVEAASEGAGHGSTFIVTLPLATQSELVAVEPQALALAPETDGEAHAQGAILLPSEVAIAGLRVLVVDDQEDARALLAEFLGRHGAVVMTASSGAEALAILSDPPGGMRPDILLCDIAMPEEDGYAALSRVRALEAAHGVAASQRIPAVALTALTGKEERLRAISSGFQTHVAKPADPAELILVIENIAWRRRKTESN